LIAGEECPLIGGESGGEFFMDCIVTSSHGIMVFLFLAFTKVIFLPLTNQHSPPAANFALGLGYAIFLVELA
jgi:hypothetical protein